MICVFALLTVGCVVLALAEGENVGSVEELGKLVDKAEKASAADAKYTAIYQVSDYITTKKINPAENGYDELMQRVNALVIAGANAYLDLVNVDELKADAAYKSMIRAAELLALFELPEQTEGYSALKTKFDAALVKAVAVLVANVDPEIETTLNTAANKIAINKVNSIIANCAPFGEVSLDDSLAALATLTAAHERATAVNYATLDAANSFTNYDLPSYIKEDWESCGVGVGNTYLNGKNKWDVDLKSTKNQVAIVEEANGNKYYTHRYLTKVNAESTFAQIAFKGVDASSGLVFEFDVAYFGSIPEIGVHIEPGGIDTDSGRVFPPNYFQLNGNGDIVDPNNNAVILPGAMVKGQWLHIVIAFDARAFNYTLYAEGQYIATYDAKHGGVTTYDHSKAAFRLSGKSNTSGDICYDNIHIYGGNHYRIHDRFSSLSDSEKFVYYVNYLISDENSIADRTTAHNLANGLLELFYKDQNYVDGVSDDVKSAVDSFLAFDIDILLKDVKESNLTTFITLVDELKQVARTANTVATRQNKASEINAFVAQNGEYIDRDSDRNANGTPDFTEYNNAFNQIVREAKYDGNASTFVRHMDRFQKALTLAAMQRYYDRAKAMINNDEIDVALINDLSNPYRNNFKDLIAAYGVYKNADKILYELEKQNNSNRIVQCMNKIKMYTTEEEWLANEELMTKYLFLVKDYVLGKGEEGDLLYDPEFEGINEALEFFNSSYGFFYKRLQDTHVEYMSEILLLILDTEAYIEKMGMVAVIDRYIATNDIDYTDARIIDILNDLDTCKAELILREKDYADLLIQNATYFINIVNRMRTSTTYAEKREYLEQAALLYFSIDSTVEGARRAIDIYNEYSEELLRAEEASKKFIDLVAIYKACETEDDKYAALVECYYNAQFVEPSFEGIPEALAEYQAAYDAYYNYANSVNEGITLTGNVVGSLRTNCGITTIIAIVIKKLFGV